MNPLGLLRGVWVRGHLQHPWWLTEKDTFTEVVTQGSCGVEFSEHLGGSSTDHGCSESSTVGSWDGGPHESSTLGFPTWDIYLLLEFWASLSMDHLNLLKFATWHLIARNKREWGRGQDATTLLKSTPFTDETQDKTLAVEKKGRVVGHLVSQQERRFSG